MACGQLKYTRFQKYYKKYVVPAYGTNRERHMDITWMLGAKPPSSPTFVASWPYFFLIMLCVQKLHLNTLSKGTDYDISENSGTVELIN